MRPGAGCTNEFSDGDQRIPFGKESRREDMTIAVLTICGDCAVELGQYHHHHCSFEECPECGDQAFICGCH
jgi:hypothetical protein